MQGFTITSHTLHLGLCLPKLSDLYLLSYQSMVVLKHTGSVQVYFLRFNKKVLLENILFFFFSHNKSNLKAKRNRSVVFAALRLWEWINLHLAKKQVSSKYLAASYAIVLLVICTTGRTPQFQITDYKHSASFKEIT